VAVFEGGVVFAEKADADVFQSLGGHRHQELDGGPAEKERLTGAGGAPVQGVLVVVLRVQRRLLCGVRPDQLVPNVCGQFSSGSGALRTR
jgi:hypothetical protein